MTDITHNSEKKIIVCRVNRKVFEWSLLWPAEGTELNPGINYKFRIAAFYSITGITVVLSAIGLCLILIFHGHLGGTNISALIAIYSMLYMLTLFIRKQHDIAIILYKLSDFTKFGKPPGFDKLDKMLNFFTKLLTAYELLGMSAYKSIAIIKMSVCKRIQTKYGLKGYYCGLGVPKWVPFDINFFPVYELFILYDFIFSFLFSKMCSQISFHVLEIALHTVLRIEHLKSLIVECFDSDNHNKFFDNLQKCILYHIEILNLANKIDHTFTTIMFVHFLLTGTICAFLGKQILEGHGVIVGCIQFLMWMAALYYACLGGQCVIDATESVADALWASKWYKADVSLQKILLIMLVRSQRSCRMTAGPFGILCYLLFLSVVKTSYSILCVLTS